MGSEHITSENPFWLFGAHFKDITFACVGEQSLPLSGMAVIYFR